MSRAFRNEEVEEGALVRARAPLPAGVPNYVTPRGLSALRDELTALRTARASAVHRGENALALAAQVTELEERIGSCELVDPAAQPHDEVRFGASVSVRGGRAGEAQYRIVGVDEADAATGAIAFTSPLARALLGREVGDVAEVRTPRGSDEIEVVSIRYEA